MNEVAAQIPTKWYLFGIEIGLQKEALDVIEKNHPKDPHRCFYEVLGAWEKQVTKMQYS